MLFFTSTILLSYNNIGWIRDLTAEGIESNPGPSWDDLLEVVKKKFPLDYPNIQDNLNRLREFLKKAFESPVITTTEVEDFFKDEKLQAEHNVPRGVANIIKEGLSSLKGIYSILFYFYFYSNSPSLLRMLTYPLTLYYMILRVCLYDCIPSSHSYYR